MLTFQWHLCYKVQALYRNVQLFSEPLEHLWKEAELKLKRFPFSLVFVSNPQCSKNLDKMRRGVIVLPCNFWNQPPIVLGQSFRRSLPSAFINTKGTPFLQPQLEFSTCPMRSSAIATMYFNLFSFTKASHFIFDIFLRVSVKFYPDG